jgi:hypothetical protein
VVAVGAVAIVQHRTPPRAVEIGALATPVTTDPTTTDDPIVASVLLGTVYPTVAQLGTVTADESGYVVRLRGDVRVTADQVAQALTRSHGSGSPGVKAALANVDQVSTVDAHTVHITLTRRTPAWPPRWAARPAPSSCRTPDRTASTGSPRAAR